MKVCSKLNLLAASSHLQPPPGNWHHAQKPPRQLSEAVAEVLLLIYIR